MNLLTDNWIPVRPQEVGSPRQISLQTLLCENQAWELALPRDDMELAALQLLICLVQVIFPPKDKKQWLERLKNPISEEEYTQSIQQYLEWFQLDHPKYPFMQVKGVKAKIVTPMDKLLTGLDTSTNSRFVNEAGLGDGLCPGCSSIALYNQANNAPSFGGGFKYGIRGSCPVSTFIRGNNLLSTLWLNVLTLESVELFLGDSLSKGEQKPTWVIPIEEKSTIRVHQIGFTRGLLWQPGSIELIASTNIGQCSCCGHDSEELYKGLNKAKFTYTIEGFWRHAHSPHTLTIKKGEKRQKFVSFTLPIPAWTQLSRYVVKRELDEDNKEGREPALVIQQAMNYAGSNFSQLELLVGGYRNNQASILDRRHEILLLNQGWEFHPKEIQELVKHGMAYKTAIRKSLWIVAEGIRATEIKGTGAKLYEVGEAQFFRVSENTMLEALAGVDFSNALPTFVDLDKKLGSICRGIFEILIKPYQHDLVLFRTIAIARRSLSKQLKENRMQITEEEVE